MHCVVIDTGSVSTMVKKRTKRLNYASQPLISNSLVYSQWQPTAAHALSFEFAPRLRTSATTATTTTTTFEGDIRDTLRCGKHISIWGSLLTHSPHKGNQGFPVLGIVVLELLEIPCVMAERSRRNVERGEDRERQPCSMQPASQGEPEPLRVVARCRVRVIGL